MWVHNDTCGCPHCFPINYPHRGNPHDGGGGVHNATCGCPKCFDINYPGRANPHHGVTTNGGGSGMVSVNSVGSTYSAPPIDAPPQAHDSVAQAIDFIRTCGTGTANPNPQTLAISFEVLIAAIGASSAPARQKKEVKQLLEEFMEHPLAADALGELAKQLRKLLGKETSEQATAGQ